MGRREGKMAGWRDGRFGAHGGSGGSGGMEEWRNGGKERWREGGMDGRMEGGTEEWREGAKEGWRYERTDAFSGCASRATLPPAPPGASVLLTMSLALYKAKLKEFFSPAFIGSNLPSHLKFLASLI